MLLPSSAVLLSTFLEVLSDFLGFLGRNVRAMERLVRGKPPDRPSIPNALVEPTIGSSLQYAIPKVP
jgi:hypothetical protein